jgi:mono/diheme cytochrome c family protein
MSAFQSLSEWDRWALVDYLMTLPPGFPGWSRWSRTGSAYPVPEIAIARLPGPVIPDSDVTPEEWRQKGRAVYILSGCWRCHGARLDGKGPDSRGLMDVWGQAVQPYPFASQYPARSGGRPNDFYRTIVTGIGGTPMPSFADDTVFIPGREEVANLDSLYHEFPRHVFQGLQSYVQDLPERAEVLAWPSPVAKAVANERRWALVDFLLEGQSRE